jgi:hypothetical protein
MRMVAEQNQKLSQVRRAALKTLLLWRPGFDAPVKLSRKMLQDQKLQPILQRLVLNVLSKCHP